MFLHNRFDRSERLKGKANFALFARARQYRGGLIRIACVKHTTAPGLGVLSAPPDIKAAFVVSKKVAQRAVKRNKLKRRLRELYKKHRNNLPQNVWLMIIALPEAAKADFVSLEADLNALFKKIASDYAGHLQH